jgi:hypothetical protein
MPSVTASSQAFGKVSALDGEVAMTVDRSNSVLFGIIEHDALSVIGAESAPMTSPPEGENKISPLPTGEVDSEAGGRRSG